MQTKENRTEKCANPGCARIVAARDPWCETCELERMLYRRDLRSSPAKEGPALESR